VLGLRRGDGAPPLGLGDAFVAEPAHLTPDLRFDAVEIPGIHLRGDADGSSRFERGVAARDGVDELEVVAERSRQARRPRLPQDRHEQVDGGEIGVIDTRRMPPERKIRLGAGPLELDLPRPQWGRDRRRQRRVARAREASERPLRTRDDVGRHHRPHHDQGERFRRIEPPVEREERFTRQPAHEIRRPDHRASVRVAFEHRFVELAGQKPPRVVLREPHLFEHHALLRVEHRALETRVDADVREEIDRRVGAIRR
jgi:hypothetical protein